MDFGEIHSLLINKNHSRHRHTHIQHKYIDSLFRIIWKVLWWPVLRQSIHYQNWTFVLSAFLIQLVLTPHSIYALQRDEGKDQRSTESRRGKRIYV